MKIKTSFLALILALMVFNTSKAEDIKIQDCSDPLEVIKFSEDQRYSIVLTSGNRIFISANDHTSWFDALTVGLTKDITDIEMISDRNLIAVGEDGLAIRTTDGGENWNEITGLPTVNFTKVKFTNKQVYILGESGTCFRSQDTGQTFIDNSLAIIGSCMDVAFISLSTGFLISDQNPSLWISRNGGANWEARSLPQGADGEMICIDQNFLYITGKAYIDTANVNSEVSSLLLIINCEDFDDWMAVPIPESFHLTGVAMKNGKGGISMNKSMGDIWRTSNAGLQWFSGVSQMNRKYYSLGIKGSQLYATSDSGTIVRIDVVTGISPINTETPSGFQLSQNYPNPFNPSTKINFSIPKSGNVKLAVYNTAGKEVAVLLNQSMAAGNYTTDFDASNLTSGVYFYTLQSESFKDSKRMILLK